MGNLGLEKIEDLALPEKVSKNEELKMGQKKDDEWITQYKITRRLTKIAAPNKNVEEREKLHKELRNLTHDFWYQKFKRIREKLHSDNAADDKCRDIQKILDIPFEPWKKD